MNTDLTDKQVENKLSYCRELLELAGIIEPGFSSFRGQLLFEFQAVKEQQAKRTTIENSPRYKVCLEHFSIFCNHQN